MSGRDGVGWDARARRLRTFRIGALDADGGGDLVVVVSSFGSRDPGVVALGGARRKNRRRLIDVESKDGDHGATLPRRPWRRATNLHVTQLIPSDLRRPTVPDTFKKKSVALLVGYVGTGFHGNTSNPQLPRGSTVDDVLEDAAFAAGGILLSNYRSKSLRRLKWSRSSRTDKGVSSLATVVSLRMELDPAAWDADVEGRAVADALNAHLPPTVRVFGVYSVPKGFQARRVCTQRTYDYLLPARCLGLPRDGVAWPGTENAGGRTDEEVLDAFRAALRSFEGSHPFHNYTRRAYYSPSNKRAEASGSGRKGKRNKSGTKGGAGMDESGAEEEDLEVDEEAEEAKEREDSLGGAGGAGEEAEAEVAGGPPYVGTRSGGYYWLLGRDEADLIGIKHMRKVTSFEAGGVETATSDADGAQTEPFVRVTVRGDSFMLYQIRKMIATAVAVALGHVPASFVPVTLVRPARAATPLAPASTLYLKRAEFMTFRKSQDANAEPGPPRMERLEASERVQGDIDAFQRAVLDPALAPALASEEWDVFVSNLGKLRIAECGDAVEAMTAQHAEYLAHRAETRARRAEETASEVEADVPVPGDDATAAVKA